MSRQNFSEFFFTDDLLKIRKEPGTSFQVTIFVEFFNKNIYSVLWHKLAKFQYQTVFTSQVFQ